MSYYSVIAENIYKKYSKDLKHSSRYGLRSLYKEIFGLDQEGLQLRESEFFAVQDVSFSLNQGDCLGLIGRNGCGKTTTLRMLNGLIKPDAGQIMMRGRVQALIALGAGFNPVLSGLENIYISAATLGLSRKETKAKIDEIIDFSELYDFIDSPVQSYSSGMYARLGFSVAIHMDPDILLIDEILSVGDFAFQTKCFAKMNSLKKDGVTIVFVTHGMTAMIQLCEEAIWLDHGRIAGVGPSKDIATKYLNSVKVEENKQEKKKEIAKKTNNTIYGALIIDNQKVENIQVSFCQDVDKNKQTRELESGKSCIVEYSFRLICKVNDLNVSLVFYRKDGLHITTISSLNGDILKKYNDGHISCKLEIDSMILNPGHYIMVMCIHDGHSYLRRNIEYEFSVVSHSNLCWGLTNFSYKWLTVKNCEII